MNIFSFNGWKFDERKEKISFLFSLKKNEERFDFTEFFILPKSLPENFDTASLSAVLDFLSLALGVSYWKTFCPEKIETGEIVLDKEQADFWNVVYTKGLGEFFYKNKIDFRGLVNFPFGKKATGHHFSQTPLSNRSLVLMGGGKDSLVSAEILRQQKSDFSLFSLGDFPLIKEAAKVVSAPHIVIGRQIDPLLLSLNKRPDVFNGHIPISLIYTGAAMLAAVLYGFDEIIISAERSADYGNIFYLGQSVNHQWSKSEEFEKLIKDYIEKNIRPKIIFSSLIRDFYEIQVAEFFSHYPKYFEVFSSCNKNFLITKKTDKKWCGECPKCAFVFATLAPFIPKAKLVSIFGKNLFADEKLLPTYRALLGLNEWKPFECVGTAEETALAFFLVQKKGEYKNDIAIRQFVSAFEKDFEKLEKSQKSLLPNYEA